VTPGAVRPGEEWGRPGPLPPGAVICGSDAEAADAVRDAAVDGLPFPPLGLVGGDLWRTLGSPGGGERRLRDEGGTAVAIDVVEVQMDGRTDWFVAHLLARGGWWRGRIVAVMNAEFMGAWDVAPRSHPGDGRVEVLDADPPLGDRLTARRRLSHGTHIPHPDIAVRRVDGTELDLAGRRVWLDGEARGRCRALSLNVLGGALDVVV